jgi:hypothetical protein
MRTALSEVQNILGSITSAADNCVTPTLLYNEGWLVKLVLRAAATGINCLPFQFEAKSKWFSEVLLRSAFPWKTESATHADAGIGHWSFDPNTKAGLLLDATCSQFVLCEAKMFSPLSKGTKYFPEWGQAARTVACMATALMEAKRLPQSYKSLALYVFAPASQIEKGVFSIQMAKDDIRQRIETRMAAHAGRPEHAGLERLRKEWALPLLDRMELDCYSWETAIGKIKAADASYGESLREFYQRCCLYN